MGNCLFCKTVVVAQQQTHMHMDKWRKRMSERQTETSTTRLQKDLERRKKETEAARQLPTILLKSPHGKQQGWRSAHHTCTPTYAHTHTITVPAPWVNTCHLVWSYTVHTSHALSLASACTSLWCEVYLSVCMLFRVCVCVCLILTQLHLTVRTNICN